MYIIDVEASGLAEESYPIQIGWQHRGDLGRFGEFLISPHPDWVYWDDYAEKKIHHISRQSLLTGMDVVDACKLLNEKFGHYPVFSDAHEADGFWLSRLFDAAHIEPMFQVRSVFSLVPVEKHYDFEKRLRKQPRPHQALADARIISDAVNFFAPY